MVAPVLWLRYSIDNRTWSKQSTIDLAAQDFYLLPDVVGEYFKRIEFEVKSKTPIRVSNVVGAQLQLQNSNRFSLVVTQDQSGLTGIRRLHLEVTENGRNYPLRIILPIYPEHLEIEQFHTMLDDISHWIFFEIASPVTLDIGYTDRFTRSLRSQQAVLDLMSKYIGEIEEILQRIAVSPRRQIKKEYYLTSRDPKRQDPVTARWSQQNPSDTHNKAFRNVSSYDVYENRFVLFFINQLEQRLAFLHHLADLSAKDKEKEIRKERSYNNSHQLEILEKQKQEAVAFGDRCLDLSRRLQLLRSIEFLKGVDFTPSQFRLNFSLALTQDFNYSRIFQFYQELGRDKAIERLDRVKTFTDALVSLGVKATHQIYEYWTFFAIYNELISLHFYPQNEDDITDMINNDVLNPYLRPGAMITLIGEKSLYPDITIRLCYDKAYLRGAKEVARPDIVMEIWWKRQLRACFVFDAKYKTYTDQTGKNSVKWFWERNREEKGDFFKISVLYQDGKFIPGGVIDKSRGAFLLHINTQDKWFENYGAIVQMSENGSWERNAHRFGFIPVVPGKLMTLRTLLSMIFLIKLEIDADICWTCSSTDVRKEVYHSQYGTEKENRRICQKCGHEWWIQRCSCGFPLFKGNFSFQIQHQELQPSSKCNGYICPGCGKCVCGATIDHICS
ncbi:MAG TPA: DUF2357 domain-containing protein [Anaerolineae bacterium]|nr:DUF2357 domain-containing protein [Anaerolineae bacterium]HQK14133.1 DUF2357 domain-containing protein [Anaerolineae bacterium]